MAIYEFGFKPASIGTTALATLGDLRIHRGTANVSSLNTIPLVLLVAAGQKIITATAAGRATTNGVSGSARLCIYETNAAGTIEGALIASNILITTTVGTVAWYSATGLSIDLSLFAGKYIKVGIQTDNSTWRRCNVSGGLSGDMVSTANGTTPPNPFGTATNQTSLIPMYLTVQDFAGVVPSGPATIGATSNITTSNFTTPVNNGTLDSVNLVSATSTTITLPNLVDGTMVPRAGTNRLLIVTNASSESAMANMTVNPPTGFAATEIQAGFNTGELNSIAYNFNPPLQQGDIFYYDPTKGTVYPDGGFTTDYVGSQIIWHHEASTKIVRSFEVITGEGGVIISVTRTLLHIGFGFGFST